MQFYVLHARENHSARGYCHIVYSLAVGALQHCRAYDSATNATNSPPASLQAAAGDWQISVPDVTDVPVTHLI